MGEKVTLKIWRGDAGQGEPRMQPAEPQTQPAE